MIGPNHLIHGYVFIYAPLITRYTIITYSIHLFRPFYICHRHQALGFERPLVSIRVANRICMLFCGNICPQYVWRTEEGINIEISIPTKLWLRLCTETPKAINGLTVDFEDQYLPIRSPDNEMIVTTTVAFRLIIRWHP